MAKAKLTQEQINAKLAELLAAKDELESTEVASLVPQGTSLMSKFRTGLSYADLTHVPTSDPKKAAQNQIFVRVAGMAQVCKIGYKTVQEAETSGIPFDKIPITVNNRVVFLKDNDNSDAEFAEFDS